MNTCGVLHLQKSPKHFTVTTTVPFSASEHTHCTLVLCDWMWLLSLHITPTALWSCVTEWMTAVFTHHTHCTLVLCDWMNDCCLYTSHPLHSGPVWLLSLHLTPTALWSCVTEWMTAVFTHHTHCTLVMCDWMSDCCLYTSHPLHSGHVWLNEICWLYTVHPLHSGYVQLNQWLLSLHITPTALWSCVTEWVTAVFTHHTHCTLVLCDWMNDCCLYTSHPLHSGHVWLNEWLLTLHSPPTALRSCATEPVTAVFTQSTHCTQVMCDWTIDCFLYTSHPLHSGHVQLNQWLLSLHSTPTALRSCVTEQVTAVFTQHFLNIHQSGYSTV